MLIQKLNKYGCTLYTEQHLYVGILKHLSKDMAQNLFQNTEVPLGARVEFYFHWSKWIKTIEPAETIPNLQSIQSNVSASALSNMNESFKISSMAPLKSSDTKNINLLAILKSNSYGTSLLKAAKDNTGKMELNENLRKVLCDAILLHRAQIRPHCGRL